jgi:hypothetical protein
MCAGGWRWRRPRGQIRVVRRTTPGGSMLAAGSTPLRGDHEPGAFSGTRASVKDGMVSVDSCAPTFRTLGRGACAIGPIYVGSVCPRPRHTGPMCHAPHCPPHSGRGACAPGPITRGQCATHPIARRILGGARVPHDPGSGLGGHAIRPRFPPSCPTSPNSVEDRARTEYLGNPVDIPKQLEFWRAGELRPLYAKSAVLRIGSRPPDAGRWAVVPHRTSTMAPSTR